jgi:glycerol-3-phosphate dehydrogenase (NAD+)
MCFNDRGEPELTSVILRDALNISCTGVLMGGNIAADVADAHPCESTLAMDCNCSEEAVACVSEVFRTDAFAIQVISDVMGAELCGALKNVIALGAGFCDGLGLSPSTKAAVVRRGLNEMRGVVKMLHPAAQDDLFFESCGVGDVLATCYSPHGRNRRCAEAFAQNGGRASWEQIERNMLNGQKLQGVRTAVGLALCLKQKECAGRFPLLCRIHAIAIEGAPVESISKWV